MIWRTPVTYDRAVMRIANAGAIMRGPATLYNGKLYRTTLDAHVLALDMKTGKQVWKQKFADFKQGYKGVNAPLIANGVMITGTTGGENATRGFLVGWDPETGKELWRTYTIPAPGEPSRSTTLLPTLMPKGLLAPTTSTAPVTVKPEKPLKLSELEG